MLKNRNSMKAASVLILLLLTSSVSINVGTSASAPSGIRLSWVQDATDTTITILWETDSSGNPCDVQYGLTSAFDIESVDDYVSLTLYVASDNYALVYINGILVDDDSGANHEYAYWNRIVDVPVSCLVEGTNTIAVFVYNSAGSSDAYFDLKLDGEVIVNLLPSINLYPGWNLISLPYVQLVEDPHTIFSSISGSYDAVQYYNAFDMSDPWKHNHKDKPSHMNDLSHVQNNMGIWIHITDSEDVLFEVPGNLTTGGQTVTLKPGWNLVGYPRLTDSTRTEGLNNTIFGTHVNKIMRFDTTTGNWGSVGFDDIFEVGRGYWMYALTSHVWRL